MIILYYMIFGITVAAIALAYVFANKILKLDEGRILKIFSVILAVLFVAWYLAHGKSAFTESYGLNSYPFYSPFLNFAVATTVWLSFASSVILTMMPFFDKFPVLKNYAKTFSLVVGACTIALLRQIIFSFTSTYETTLCGVFFTIWATLSFAYSLYVFVRNDFFFIKSAELIEMLEFLPAVLIFSIPPYLFQAYFKSFGSGLHTDLKIYHRIYIYLAFAYIFITYFALKNKGRLYARMVLLYISLASLIAYCYNYSYADLLKPTAWPLHLCNTAMFILPICLTFKLEKLFYFTLFINVLGAFFAILMPNTTASGSVIDDSIISFWQNHIQAFAMPVLVILLKVYDRPNVRFFTYSMIGFAIYFLIVLILNAWFTNYDKNTDFFFLNSDFIAKKLGAWAKNLRNTKLSFTINDLEFVFYPVYQALFFVAYIFLGLGMWFLYAYMFQIQDFYDGLNAKRRAFRAQEIDLCDKHGKTSVNDCRDGATIGKLEVDDLSKRYPKKERYSAKDVSFEVHPGEILGFLGPNGAGKSTIIKSIVGIHAPTAGTARVNGYDSYLQAINAKKQTGFVPDHYAFSENLTGREYVNHIADLYGVSKRDRDERLEKLLKELEMERAIDNKIQTYSHGMKQKIAIISALVHEPKLWILDEPLTGLDPNSVYQVKKCMKEHAAKGNVVFFSSHIIDIVEKLCDRIVIIKKGKIRAIADVKELKEKGVSLEDYYMKIISEDDGDGDEMIYREPIEEPIKENVFFEPLAYENGADHE